LAQGFDSQPNITRVVFDQEDVDGSHA